MRRFAVLSTVMGVFLVVPAVAVSALIPAAAASPPFGGVGTAIVLSISDFTPGSTFEVHGQTFDGPLLGTGTTSAGGEGEVGVTIPSSASEGEYTLAVCEITYVACTDTTNDFWVGATATFTVIPPPPTTTGIPEVLLEPDTGEAGSTTTVSISGFTPDSTFEVHIGDLCCGLLGSGTSNGVGEAAILVRIPDGLAGGELTISVCETQFVACTDWTSDFWVGATAPFTVVAPPPTTTEAPTTTSTGGAEATTATTGAAETTTTTTDIATTSTGPVDPADPDSATPIFGDDVDDSSSGPWWVIAVVFGSILFGFLIARRVGDRG